VLLFLITLNVTRCWLLLSIFSLFTLFFLTFVLSLIICWLSFAFYSLVLFAVSFQLSFFAYKCSFSFWSELMSSACSAMVLSASMNWLWSSSSFCRASSNLFLSCSIE
jgi:hypothetical protein